MADNRELLRGNTQTLVLAVLQDGPLHGYAIASEINRRTQGALQCKHGTLYPALTALDAEGLIEGGWTQEGDERPRKVYRLTEVGRAELARRIRSWREFSGAMESVIGGSPDAQPA